MFYPVFTLHVGHVLESSRALESTGMDDCWVLLNYIFSFSLSAFGQFESFSSFFYLWEDTVCLLLMMSSSSLI